MILNFSFNGNISKVIAVHWRDGKDKPVYDIINGTEKAGPEYEGRASFSWGCDGNFFIKIEHLKSTDEGEHVIFFTGLQRYERIKLSVNGE